MKALLNTCRNLRRFTYLVGSLFVFAAPVTAAGIDWRTDYRAALVECKAENKPLVCYFCADSCPHCVRMEKETFASLAQPINEYFVPVKVKAPAYPTDALKLTRFPTIILAMPDSTIKERHTGFVDAKTLAAGLEKIDAELSEDDSPAHKPQSTFKVKGCVGGCACGKCDKGCNCGQRPCSPECQCVAQAAAFVGPPKQELPPVDLLQNPGCMTEHIASTERFTVNGLELPAFEGKRQLFGLGSKTDVPEDADFLRVTVIGHDGDRKRVAEDMAHANELAKWKTAVVFNSYPPEHWAVSGMGYAAGSLYVQAPSGKVLHRQELRSYGGPAELDRALAQAEAVRKKNPDYRPEKDPDLRNSWAGDSEFPVAVIAVAGVVVFLAVCGFVVCVGFYLFLRRK